MKKLFLSFLDVLKGDAGKPAMPSLVPLRSSLVRLIPLSSMLFAAAGGAFSQAGGASPFQAKGAWFGQTPPGETPVPFAPELFKPMSNWVETSEFSPDGTVCFISVGDANYASSKLLYSMRVNDIWTPFADAPFLSGFSYSNEAVFLADGKTLMFTGVKGSANKDLWTVAYDERGWGQPVALPAPINSDRDEFRGCRTSDGTLYFCSDRSGMIQIYRGRKDTAGAWAVEALSAPINTNSYEGDPCVAPDGRFLVFHSGRDGKSTDLYACFADGRGGWSPPALLKPGFKTSFDEYGSHLSSDGKYLFFTRHSPQGNGIYWVSVSAVERLKP